MTRFIVTFVGGVLLASVTFAVTAAEPLCPMENGGCPGPLVDDSAVDAGSAAVPAEDLTTLPADPATLVDTAIPDAQPVPPVTRTLGPPTVVNPFVEVASPAAPQVDQPLPQPGPAPDAERLPPGPATRRP